MKIFNAVFLCCLVAGAQASFLDDLTSAFKNLADGVLAAGSVVGSSLLDQVKQTGMTLASTAVGQLVNQLDEVGQTKRDVSAVAHELGPLVQGLQQAMGEHSEAQKVLFSFAIKELEQVAAKMVSLDNTPLSDILKEIDSIVGGHSQVADLLMEAMKTKVTSMAPHKRSLVDSLGQVGTSLTSMFSPQIESLKGIVSSVGDALKQAAAGLFSSLAQSVMSLGPALAPHSSAIQTSGSAIAGEGQNALDALKGAVSDIFQQTLTNVQPHINNIVQHGTQAVSAAAGQLLTNMLTSAITGGASSTEGQ